ncbi:hypothetical protein ACLQ2N_32900 [Streptomyces sp. DT224]|uniref:hypothetical protein n=1 Tax=Streptomyces sp. DT224 TaxID=3393426 RepID=UPI003CEFAAD6
MNTTPMPRSAATATKVFERLMASAFLSQEHMLLDLAPHAGLLWRCLCKQVNPLNRARCKKCSEARLWTTDVTPTAHNEYGALLEDLRTALTGWFDDRPKERRPAAIGFRVTTEYDDGPAWATDAVAYFTDCPVGKEYGTDFKRSSVSEALVELGDFDRPQVGHQLRVAIPSPFAEVVTDVRGNEYAYPISEYAREAASVLAESGEGWESESGYIGAYGTLWGPNTPTLRVWVDEWNDLTVARDDNPDDKRVTVDLPNGAPSLPREMRAVAEDIADIIRTHFI